MILSQTFSGTIPTGLTLQGVHRSDSAGVAGLPSLPSAFVNAGDGRFVFVFADAQPLPEYYRYSFRQTWVSGQYEDLDDVSTPATGNNVELDLTFPSGSAPTAVSLSQLIPLPTGLSLPAAFVGGNAGAAGSTVWGYEIVGSSAVASYSYTGVATIGGVGAPFSGILPVAPALGVANDVNTWLDWQNYAGSDNLLNYDDKDGTGNLNLAGAQRAMFYSQSEREQALGSVYATPLVFNAGTPTETVKYWDAVIGIGRWLYMGRGLSDADKVGDKWAKMVMDVYREMRRSLSPPNLLPCAMRSGVRFGVSCVDPARARNAVPPTPQRIWLPGYGRRW